MIKDVVQIGDPVLETVCTPITDPLDPKTQTLVQDLLDTCISLAHRSAGISAPQIGVTSRICICRRTDLEELEESKNPEKPAKVPDGKLWEVMINPEIKNISSQESIYWEGCLSIGATEKDTLFGPVSRPDNLIVEYLNREGEKKTLNAKDFFAHVVQHEIDHLNGILFVYKVKNPDRNIWKAPNLDKYIDKTGQYPPVI